MSRHSFSCLRVRTDSRDEPGGSLQPVSVSAKEALALAQDFSDTALKLPPQTAENLGSPSNALRLHSREVLHFQTMEWVISKELGPSGVQATLRSAWHKLKSSERRDLN